MTPIERVERVLAGKQADRPPVSFWHHFAPDQVHGPKAVAAHLAHVEAFDLDFLKVMNDNGYPRAGRVERVADLASLGPLRGDEAEFTRQLELLAELKRALKNRVLTTTTIFNAWATLRRVVEPPTGHGPPNLDASADVASGIIKDFIKQDADAVQRALDNIGASLAIFARRCIEAGADGVYLSVRDDWLAGPDGDRTLYDELVRPTDLRIIEGAAAGRFNMLHVCGTPVALTEFARYPVHVINWADRAAGPAISEVVRKVEPAICGGLDNLNTLPSGTPEDCANEVRDALRQAGDRPILIAPGCTYDPQQVTAENLQAVCRAVRA